MHIELLSTRGSPAPPRTQKSSTTRSRWPSRKPVPTGHSIQDKENAPTSLLRKGSSRSKKSSKTRSGSGVKKTRASSQTLSSAIFSSVLNFVKSEDSDTDCDYYADASDDGSDEEDLDHSTIFSAGFCRRLRVVQDRPYIVYSSVASRNEPPVRPKHKNPEIDTYTHRGHSWSALAFRKTLWRDREHMWAVWNQRRLDAVRELASCTDDAHAALLTETALLKGPPPYPSHIPSLADSQGAHIADSTTMNPALYPRMGDLRFANDSFMVASDQVFANYDLWTLRKMGWMFDLGHRLELGVRKRSQKVDISTEDSGTALAYLLEAGSSREQGEAPPSSVSTVRKQKSGAVLKLLRDFEDIPLESDTSGDHIISSGDTSSTLAVHDLSPSGSVVRVIVPSASLPWESNWFIRWEVLLRQVILAINQANTQSTSGPLSILYSSTPSIFSDSDYNEAAEQLLDIQFPENYRGDHHEEDDDYGTLVSNPVFSNQESAYILGG